MQPGRWNETASQAVRTRIIVNGVTRKGKAHIDAQCFEGHPSKAATSPASTCTLDLIPPWTTSSVGPSPVITQSFPAVSWPPIAGQSVTVDVGDGVRWWRCFTGRVDATQGTLSDGSVQIECVDESVKLDLAAPRKALHHSAAFSSAGSATSILDLQSSTLVDHAARSAGFHSRLEPAWEAKAYLPMVGSAHPILGDIYYASDKINPAGYDRPSWFDGDGWVIGDKLLNFQFEPSSAPVEVTMDLPPRNPGNGWVVLTLRGAVNVYGIRRGPFIAYDHDENVIRFGFRTSRSIGGDAVPVPTSSVSVQGTPIPRGTATRVAMRFNPRSPDSTQHHFIVRTNAGATTDVRLTDSSGAIEAFWAASTAEYFSGGAMGAVQIVGSPASSFGQLNQTPTARIRYKETAWLDATRDEGDIQARTTLTRLAAAECGAFWVDRNAHLQYTGPLVRETQAVTATLTTDLDINGWSWSYNFEQRAKRARINSLDCATWPSKRNSLLWSNQSGGAETLEPGDLWEQIVAAPEDEDWLYVDDTPVQMFSDKGRADLIGSTTHGATLTHDAGGEAWEAFQVAWTFNRLGNRAVKWSAKASNTIPADERVDLRIPNNATNVPAWWRGRALPRLLGSKIKWVEKSATAPTPATTGDEEYVHEASWYVQSPNRLAELRDYLNTALSKVLPVYDAVPVRADPRYDVGDRIYLNDKLRSYIRYDAVILGIVGDWEDGGASMSLKVRLTGFEVTDLVALADGLLNNQPHWLQSQPSWERAT